MIGLAVVGVVLALLVLRSAVGAVLALASPERVQGGFVDEAPRRLADEDVQALAAQLQGVGFSPLGTRYERSWSLGSRSWSLELSAPDGTFATVSRVRGAGRWYLVTPFGDGTLVFTADKPTLGEGDAADLSYVAVHGLLLGEAVALHRTRVERWRAAGHPPAPAPAEGAREARLLASAAFYRTGPARRRRRQLAGASLASSAMLLAALGYVGWVAWHHVEPPSDLERFIDQLQGDAGP